MRYIKKLFLLLLLIIAVITIIDTVKIFTYKIYPANPFETLNTEQDFLYAELKNGNDSVNWNRLQDALYFIGNEYDTSDFKLVNLIRILYEYGYLIPAEVRVKIDSVLLNFSYWMGQSAQNSMCYWSENHQILFSSAEFLLGKFYENRIFSKYNLTGKQQAENARKKILDWLEMRWLYGFTEFYSGTYYVEDVAALLNLIDLSNDKEIVQKSKIILDLLFYDIAVQSYRGMTVSVSGRAYENNRKGGIHENMGGIGSFLFEKKDLPIGMIYSLSRTENYTIPSVLRDISKDTATVIVKQSNGIDINELETENFKRPDTKSIMMQWGMEAFTHPDIISNSMQYIRKNNMFSNDFLKDFRYLDFTVLNVLSLEKTLSKIFRLSVNGKAIQRGNTYTYRTKNYSLYSVQSYQSGDYSDQHHVSGMNIGNYFSIFHTHPARKPTDRVHSPNYWVGYGRLPHVAQDKNISIAIYNIPDTKNIMEKYLLDYTHAYFPKEKFDSVIVSDRYVFGQKKDIFCAFIGCSNFEFISSDDLIQPGRKTVWILEAGSRENDGSFDNFIRRIKNNSFHFDNDLLKVTYKSSGNKYELKFGDIFTINESIVDVNYPRFSSPYVQTDRKPKKINISHNGKELLLDFYNMERIIK